MKSFSDKTNIGWNNPLKTVYRMNFYLLFLLIGSLSILGSTRAYCQQSKTISGIVKNSQGETIIGANIVEKGTSNGTITNVDGQFTLHVAPNAILKVSYMGYTEQEVNTQIHDRKDTQKKTGVVLLFNKEKDGNTVNDTKQICLDQIKKLGSAAGSSFRIV